MATHELKLRFTDKQGNRGKIRLDYPNLDIDEYDWFELDGEDEGHIVIAFDEKPDLDEIFSDDEEPEIIKGTDEDGNKVYIIYANIDDLSDFELEGEDDEIIAVKYDGGDDSRSHGSKKSSRHRSKRKSSSPAPALADCMQPIRQPAAAIRSSSVKKKAKSAAS